MYIKKSDIRNRLSSLIAVCPTNNDRYGWALEWDPAAPPSAPSDTIHGNHKTQVAALKAGLAHIEKNRPDLWLAAEVELSAAARWNRTPRSMCWADR